MAKLADALRSGRSEGYLMRVQVPPSAQQAQTRWKASFLFCRILCLVSGKPPDFGEFTVKNEANGAGQVV